MSKKHLKTISHYEKTRLITKTFTLIWQHDTGNYIKVTALPKHWTGQSFFCFFLERCGQLVSGQGVLLARKLRHRKIFGVALAAARRYRALGVFAREGRKKF